MTGEFSELSAFDEVEPSGEESSFDSVEGDSSNVVDVVSPDVEFPDVVAGSDSGSGEDTLDPTSFPDMPIEQPVIDEYGAAPVETPESTREPNPDTLDPTSFPDMPIEQPVIDEYGAAPVETPESTREPNPETLDPDPDAVDAVEPPEPSGQPVIDEYGAAPVETPESTREPNPETLDPDPDAVDAVEPPEPSGQPVIDEYGAAPVETPESTREPNPETLDPDPDAVDAVEPPEPSGQPVIDEYGAAPVETPESTREPNPETLDPDPDAVDAVEPPEPSGQPVIDEYGAAPVETPESTREPNPDTLDPTSFPDMPIEQPVIDEYGAAPVEIGDVPQERPSDVIEPPLLTYEQGGIVIDGVTFDGTCGPTTGANTLNSLFGDSEFTEESMLRLAVDTGGCIVSDDPDLAGGTSTQQQLDNYELAAPGRVDLECHEFEDALGKEGIAERLESGSIVNVAVDASTLWGTEDPNGMFDDGSGLTNHWLEVNGVHRDENGVISGFDIVDSGGGASFVDAHMFDAMCYGYEGHLIEDPTCIVVSKKA